MAIGQHVKRALAEKATEAELLAATARDAEAAETSPEEVEAAEAQKETTAQAAGGLNISVEQLLMLVKAGAMSEESVARIAAEAAKAVAGTQKKHEEKNPEKRSVYNPEGDRDHPRQKLKFYMYFGSAPLGSPKEVNTLTVPEIEALNQVTPGLYTVQKMDGTKVVVEVKGQYDSNRRLERQWILLPQGDDQKNLYPPMAAFARQLCDANRMDPVLGG